MAKHHNILYTLVVILLIVQMTSFFILAAQTSRVRSDFEEAKKNITNHFEALLQDSKLEDQQKFNEISGVLLQQKSDFSQQIKLIKSSQADFSGIINDAVKSVVSVATDRAMGTGFLVSSSGYVVTNQHVIDQANQIKVLDYDRNVHPALLIAEDNLRDLALLKIDGSFSYLKLGDSSAAEVGNKVIAIGNPLGLSFSVTEGIISALNRKGTNGLQEYIQTDVSLNPGNSGGPLINTAGEIIGINNFKLGGSEGLGFALESNAIKLSINTLVNQTLIR